MASTYKTPKNCIVHRVELHAKGGATVGYRCGMTGTEDEHGRLGPHHDAKSGGMGTYPTRYLRRVTQLRFRGLNVSGPATVGFVLVPASAKCQASGRELTCSLVGDTSSKSLAGARRRKKR